MCTFDKDWDKIVILNIYIYITHLHNFVKKIKLIGYITSGIKAKSEKLWPLGNKQMK